jgi:hypothetical protein
VILWRSISSESAASPSQTHAIAPTGESTPLSAPSVSTTGAATPSVTRPPLPEIRRRTEDERPAEPSADVRAVTASGSGEAPTKNPPGQWGLPHMRERVTAIEPKVNECLTQAQSRGDKPTGDATLTFVASKKGDKIVIEDTNYDHDGTSLKNESLVECLQGTSNAITFDGLPRNANAVFVTRTVKVENGALVENKLVKFSYIH